ncbi:P450-derived glycosyltransferase activator [Streptomyces sp. NPDC000594]|uniref:cytochrome P450 family protein n=1 Tax=Streptomyces sp. NPDC000594 TaxID=3154261 RepID=UPI00332E6964
MSPAPNTHPPTADVPNTHPPTAPAPAADVPTADVSATDGLAATGRRLQLTRAAQWFAGTCGDPYALILRAEAADPGPYEERVRALGPLFRGELPDTWVTASRVVADTVIDSPDFDGRTGDGPHPGARELPLAGTALDADRAAFGRLAARTAWGGPLMPAPHRRALRESAERHARTLLDPLADSLAFGGTADLLDAYARRLPALVIREQLGVPEALTEPFADALAGCRRTLDSLLCPQLLADAVALAKAEADLTAVLGRSAAGRDPEAVAAARALAVGAAEPTATLVGNAVRTLLERPGQWAALAQDPGLAPAAVTETLRVMPPVRLEQRVAREDTEILGERIPAGGRLVILVAAVNRDTDPAPFDLARPSPGPFGLPADLHFRLGGPLIAAVAEAALGALAARLPGLRAAGPVVRRRRSPVLHGYARFPVAAAPAASDPSAAPGA